MKKLAVLLCAALLLVFVLSGCSRSLTELDSSDKMQGDQPQSSAPDKGQDYTVEVSAYDIDPAIVVPIGLIASENSYPYPCQTVSELDNGSFVIITGTIVRREFFAFEGIAHTKLDIEVNTSIKGEFSPGDKLSIVQSGGYVSIADIVAAQDNGFRFAEVPEDEWATTYFFEPLMEQEFPNVGEEYAYFLQTGSLIAGSYWPANDCEGAFKLEPSGYYTRYNPVEGYLANDIGSDTGSVINSFTLEELFVSFG